MKLLLIDDQPETSDLMRRRLEIEHNQVSVSPDWQTGCLMIRQAHYDAVLLTLQRAENEGVDLSDCWPVSLRAVPLILLISPDTSANKAWGLESGADDCVGCTVDGRELNARLYALHRRRAGQPAKLASLRIADLDVNVFDKAVYRGGKRINLWPREFALLVFLLENQGCVVSKKEIMEQVWHKNGRPASNLIEVYINYLRNKIDRCQGVKLIHTIVGMGYIIRVTDND